MATKKILVIDYDQAVLASLHKVLSEKGYDVVLAGDGKTGWEKYEQDKPDLVLTEAMLSKIHGFELCEKIAKGSPRKVPVFIMTGVYRDRVYRTEALRTYGAAEFFEKPLRMPDLLAAVHTALGSREPFPTEEDMIQVEPAKVKPTNGGTPKLEGPALAVRPAPGPKPAPAAAGRAAAPHSQKPPSPVASEPGRPAAAQAKAGNLLDLNLMVRETTVQAAAQKQPDNHQKKPAGNPLAAATILPGAAPEKPREAAKGADTKEAAGKEIDLLLASTLADFDLGPEKKKPAEKPKPVPVPGLADLASAFPDILGVTEPAKTTHPAAGGKTAPEPAPPAPKAERRPEMKARAVDMPQPKPARNVHPAPVTPPVKPKTAPSAAPAAAVPARPQSAPSPHPARAAEPAAMKIVPIEVLLEGRAEEPAPGDIFSQPKEALAEEPSRLFKDIYEPQKKKIPTVVMGIGAAVVVLAAAAFLFLKPKHQAPPQDVNSASSQVQAADVTPPDQAAKPVETVKPPTPKPKDAKAGRPAQPLVPSVEEAVVLPQNAAGTAPIIPGPSDTKPAQKAEETKPSVPPGNGSEGQTPSNPAAAPANPAPAPANAMPDKVKAGDLVSLDTVDVQPRAIKTINPAYPPQAQRLGVEGTVTVNALINENGDVISTGILKGLADDRGLERAAEAAVRKWKFQPAVKDGVNVKVWKAIAVNFKAKS